MNGVAYQALLFANSVHVEQRRKYTDTPYVEHLVEVAGLVATVDPTPTSLAVALLHDCKEDQDVEHHTLTYLFGATVAVGVDWLTDKEVGNRATRKAAACERLSRAPGWVQTIKCADIISNTKSIVQFDPQFAKVYVPEMFALLNVLNGADPRLHRMAFRSMT